MSKCVAVDFDGTLHPYTEGWVGYDPADEPPMPGAREFLEALKARDYRAVVVSARCDMTEGTNGIWRWLERTGLAALVDGVTCQKVPAVAYVGRWMVPYSGDWEEIIGPPKSERERSLMEKRRGPTPDLSESEWGYIGGLIDGEGCITGAVNGNGNPYVRLMVTNQHRGPLEWIADRIGGSIHSKKPTSKNGYHFPIYQWTVGGIRMAPLLEGCLARNVIRMKEPQARLALEFLADCRYDGRPGGQLTKLQQAQRLEGLSDLNRKGVAVLEAILVDDRAVPFESDWQAVLDRIDRLDRRPHGAAPDSPAEDAGREAARERLFGLAERRFVADDSLAVASWTVAIEAASGIVDVVYGDGTAQAWLDDWLARA